MEPKNISCKMVCKRKRWRSICSYCQQWMEFSMNDINGIIIVIMLHLVEWATFDQNLRRVIIQNIFSLPILLDPPPLLDYTLQCV